MAEISKDWWILQTDSDREEYRTLLIPAQVTLGEATGKATLGLYEELGVPLADVLENYRQMVEACRLTNEVDEFRATQRTKATVLAADARRSALAAYDALFGGDESAGRVRVAETLRGAQC